MTLADDNSIYVGGLACDITEDTLRRAFEIFGAIVDIKINDRQVGGKCYGFVTFTNPRSATNAITDMDGKTIDERIIRVSEVRTRGGRPNFRESFRRIGRDVGWDREKERDLYRDRDHYRDRNTERWQGRDRERERDYERGHNSDQARDQAFDRGRDVEDRDGEHTRDYGRDSDWNRDMDIDRGMETDNFKDCDGNRDNTKEQKSRYRLDDHLIDRRSRELSLDSGGGYHEMKEELELSYQKYEERQKEIAQINELVKEKEQQVSDLKKKSQQLELSLADAKKRSSQQKTTLKKLHRSFLQAQDYAGKLKSSEQELQLLVDTTMAELETVDDVNTGIGSLHSKGEV